MTETIRIRNVDPLRGGKVDLAIDAPGAVPPSVGLVVRRGTMQDPFLGPSGWQATEHRFAPVGMEERGPELVMRFGPDLVDNALRDADVLQLSIPELDVVDVVTWTGVTRSVAVSEVPGGNDGKEVPPIGEDDPPPPPPGPPIRMTTRTAGPAGPVQIVLEGPEARPADAAMVQRDDPDAPYLGPAGWQSEPHSFPLVDEGEQDGARVLRLGRDDLPDGVPAKGDPVSIVVPALDLDHPLLWPFNPVTPPPGPGKPEPRGWLVYAAVAAAVVALAAGAWFYLQPPEDGGTDEVIAVVEDPPEDEAPAEESAEEADLAPGQAAYERGLAAVEAGDCAAARTEMRAAEEAEYPPAFLYWAEAQDSLEFEPCLAETSNDIRALGQYERACAAGLEGASESFDALVADLERRAERGESVAEEVVRLVVPATREVCDG